MRNLQFRQLGQLEGDNMKEIIEKIMENVSLCGESMNTLNRQTAAIAGILESLEPYQVTELVKLLAYSAKYYEAERDRILANIGI